MTTTVIDTGTVSDITDGFDLRRMATPSLSRPTLSSVRRSHNGASAVGVAATSSMTATSSARLRESISIQSTFSDYSEVWVAAQGIVEGSNCAWGIDISAGSFTIQNYGQVLCAGGGGDRVGTGGAGNSGQ